MIAYACFGNVLVINYSVYCIALLCIVFIHFYSTSHEPLRSAPDHSNCHCVGSLHAEALHATVSEGLVQGPYVAARVGFETTTLWSKGIDSTNASPRSTKCV